MKQLLNTAKQAVGQFGKDEDGAQVVEYALVIAMVSIVLAIALSALNLNVAALSTRIANCLDGNAATAC